MDVGKNESDQVAREGLHLTIDAETMSIDLWILFGLLVVEGVESFRDGIVFAESLFAGHHRECFLGTNLNN